MKKKYITPAITSTRVELSGIIAQSLLISGDGDQRDPNAGQLVRPENKLQPFSTHLWDEKE